MFKRFFFGLYQFGYYSILSVAALLLGLLGIQTLFGGTFIPLKISEAVFFTNNSPVIYLYLLLFLLFLLVLYPLLAKISSKQLFLICSLVYIIAGIYLIVNNNASIRADAKHVYEAALAFNRGDYSSLTTPGAYLYRNPHQLGLVTLERIYTSLFPHTQFAFLMNLLWVLASNFLLYRLTDQLVKHPMVTRYTILLTFLFFPNFLFILFVYGSTPGLFFCLLALWFFVQSEKDRKAWYLIPGSLAISLACSLRNNYQIFAIMLLGIFFLSLIRKWKWRKALAIIMIVASLLLSTKIIRGYYSDVPQRPIGPGTPLISYVTMGLRDDPNRATLGGWYDAYNTKILKRFNYNEEKATKQARIDLFRRIAIFMQNPAYAVKFFYQKVRSTWTEPTFQSIWTGPQVDRQQYTYTPLLRSIYEGKEGYQLANQFGMVLIMACYLASTGLLLYKMFWARLSLQPWELYAYIFFLGGFGFHFFWETKSQYVYMYVLLLMPSLAQAFVLSVEAIKQKFTKK